MRRIKITKLVSLKKRSIVHQFLKRALDQPLNGLRQYLWTNGYENGCAEEEKLEMELVRLILTDFTATCEKPDYPAVTNERTPFVESIVPIFKYLSAIMGSITFVWCEKGLSICVPVATKLLDGIGMTTLDHIHRILIESSGLGDGIHTEEDTLNKLRTTRLQKPKLFGLQFVDYKLTLLSTFVVADNRWACVWERSTLIPHRWSERKYWFQVFELLFTLKDMIKEQDILTEQLINEHTGAISVPREDMLRARCK
ncbi:hypothetical protein G6F64_000370 [Rhizopus arrhizus]|uniref:Uncharacterized protein n=1 Tax=Rhizopus oryzae TaxID=64495 RepID=A0A9P6XK83_RHIOR|nr:hypothetical protein G6F64_000370 [Rhizopus arrhizus]